MHPNGYKGRLGVQPMDRGWSPRGSLSNPPLCLVSYYQRNQEGAQQSQNTECNSVTDGLIVATSHVLLPERESRLGYGVQDSDVEPCTPVVTSSRSRSVATAVLLEGRTGSSVALEGRYLFCCYSSSLIPYRTSFLSRIRQPRAAARRTSGRTNSFPSVLFCS